MHVYKLDTFCSYNTLFCLHLAKKKEEEICLHPEKVRPPKKCTNRSILFILDASGSISPSEFEEVRMGVASLSRMFCGEVKFALMTFGTEVYLETCFNCYDHSFFGRKMFSERAKQTQQIGGATHTGAAIACAENFVFQPQCGYDPDTSKDRCIDIVLFTDGQSNGGYGVCDKIECLHKSPHLSPNLRIHAIAVGESSQDELSCIRTGQEDSIFAFQDISSINQVISAAVSNIILEQVKEIRQQQNEARFDCANWNSDSNAWEFLDSFIPII